MTKTNLLPSVSSTNDIVTLTNDIRGIKAPVEIANVWFWVWLAVALLLLAALCWWAWRRWRRKEALVTPEIVVPAHEKAWQKLQEALGLLSQPRPFCILVSDTVRTYLEERFSLRAPERTTEEFLDELQFSPMLNPGQKQSLEQFLVSCDLAKFARYEPGEAELMSIHGAAVRLVEETRPQPAAAEEAGSGQPPRALHSTTAP
jgi:hypothetical protein